MRTIMLMTATLVLAACTGLAQPTAERPAEAHIEGVPSGQGSCNSLAGGLTMLLRQRDESVEYGTVMGDLGLAFVFQGQTDSPIIDGAPDVGWWPMASWGGVMGLGLLSEYCGWKIEHHRVGMDDWKADPAAYYDVHLGPMLETSIIQGDAVLCERATWFLATGYDEGDPPIMGIWTLSENAEPVRMDAYPYGLITLGDEVEPIDQSEADIRCLQRAAALMLDKAAGVPEERTTGQKTFQLWAAALRDEGPPGQARWHANMVLHLGINRTAAVEYLTAMAERHDDAVAAQLGRAIDRCEELLEFVGTMDTSHEALIDPGDDRAELAEKVEQAAAMDREIADAIMAALRAAQ